MYHYQFEGIARVGSENQPDQLVAVLRVIDTANPAESRFIGASSEKLKEIQDQHPLGGDPSNVASRKDLEFKARPSLMDALVQVARSPQSLNAVPHISTFRPDVVSASQKPDFFYVPKQVNFAQIGRASPRYADPVRVPAFLRRGTSAFPAATNG